jgi:hypothetical protein
VNSRKELENDHLKSQEFLDVANLPGDIVMINGPMFREQKFFYTNLILNPELIDIAALLRPDNGPEGVSTTDSPAVDSDAISFDAIGCLATRSLGSAGWDGENVRLVFSVDFPTDLCLCTQEKGRAGQWPGAGPKTDEYYVCATLYSFLYLLKRIYTDEKDKDFAASDKILSLKEYRAMLFDDLLQVAKMFILSTECYHCYLARCLANPFLMDFNLSVPLSPCGSACDFCLRLAGDSSATKPPPSVLKSGVKRMLLDLFIGDKRILNPIIDETFVKAIQKYPNVQSTVFGSSSKKIPKPMQVEQLVLMLLVSSIVTFQVNFDDDDETQQHPKIVARLNVTSSGKLCYKVNSFWVGIPLRYEQQDPGTVVTANSEST